MGCVQTVRLSTRSEEDVDCLVVPGRRVALSAGGNRFQRLVVPPTALGPEALGPEALSEALLSGPLNAPGRNCLDRLVVRR